MSRDVRLKKKMHFGKFIIPVMAVLIVSCAGSPDSAPGINRPEHDALISTYYWKPEFGEPSHDHASLALLMDRSLDPELDGERAEGHSSALILALASSGDDFFASVLATRAKEVQQAVERYISSAWTFNHLEYPKTQTIYKKTQAEQGVGGQPATSPRVGD